MREASSEMGAGGGGGADIETLEWGAGGGSNSGSSCSGSGDICRICHCESDPANPLLAPCYCSGSLKYVHRGCLQQWLTASDTRSCELCKFQFVMRAKIKPLSEWRGLDMSGVERRRLCCAVLFHCVAALCVMWSLFVLVDRAAEEIQKGLIAWPFWTKLVVVAVGLAGGAVFMYVQCRQYWALCSRWRCHNRILLIQNAPDKAQRQTQQQQQLTRVRVAPTEQSRRQQQQQQQQQRQPLPPPPPLDDEDESGGFDDYRPSSFRRTLDARPPLELVVDRAQPPLQPRVEAVYHIASDAFDRAPAAPYAPLRAPPPSFDVAAVPLATADPLELNIREMLELDARAQRRDRSALSLDKSARHGAPAPCHRAPSASGGGVAFKSLPNLSASSENLLPAAAAHGRGGGGGGMAQPSS